MSSTACITDQRCGEVDAVFCGRNELQIAMHVCKVLWQKQSDTCLPPSLANKAGIEAVSVFGRRRGENCSMVSRVEKPRSWVRVAGRTGKLHPLVLCAHGVHYIHCIVHSTNHPLP